MYFTERSGLPVGAELVVVIAVWFVSCLSWLDVGSMADVGVRVTMTDKEIAQIN